MKSNFGETPQVSKKSVKRWTMLIISVIILVVALASLNSLFEDVDADKIVVNQVPITGTLEFWTEPGLYVQAFGATTEYEKAFQFWFTADADRGADKDQSKKIIFNDAGIGWISGSVRILMPRGDINLRAVQMDFGSMQTLQEELVRETVNKVIFSSGPLMSSYESYAVKKNDLINYIEDQLQNGIYKTLTREKKEIDPLSGKEKTVQIAGLIENAEAPGGFERQEIAPFSKYGLQVAAVTVDDIKYEDRIVEQISQQQKALMQVKTAIAEAKEAEQEAIKVEAQGKAAAAKAKWEQEVKKAQAVTEAQQKKEVAQLDKDAALYTKQKQILLGEGEAAYKRLVMQADGALKQKLDAYIKVNEFYAKAIAQYSGNWVPTTVLGGSGGTTPGGGAQMMIDLLTAKTAQDLNLNAKPTK